MSCGFRKGKEALKFRLDETGKNKKKKRGGVGMWLFYIQQGLVLHHM